MSEINYPVSFRFEVRVAEAALAAGTAADASFEEVSGLSVEVETSSAEENRFVHRLPAGPTHANLVLKRGVMKVDSLLAEWTRGALEGGLSAEIETRTVVVTLVSLDGAPVASWTCLDAYPVRMSVDEFTAKDDDIVVETIEFAYRSVERG
jgi:phage tail-like protein